MSWHKKGLLILLPILLLGMGVLFFFTNDEAVETVKRKAAEIQKQEYIPNQNLTIESRMVVSARDSIYQDFRTKYRFHYQTIGVASFPDSSKMILISEPPPYFVLDSLNVIFSQFTHEVSTYKHKMGYDGYAVDVIISLANATQENVTNLVKKLATSLFLSDYKPFFIELPVTDEKVYFTKENIDYQISLFEFNEWFLEEDEQFMSLKDTSTTFSIEEIFNHKNYGVFFSQLPGFVAWSMPKNSDLDSTISNIRHFVLDADLILGALADSSTLVIVGREREASLQELPPLYVESILLLASVSEKELSQSLDVNDFMAGKMKNGRDWCPTYLSKELENTEFGHLMTITDILLKDWSENGTIQEYNYCYPSPSYYPFDQPLFKKLGISELVYNWNTANAMYAIDLDNITIYTLNRTGSLPVSYFNSPESGRSIGRNYERKAYSYFATCGNTDLARVVQYTALYQLFMDNGITYSGNLNSSFPKNKPFLLLEPTRDLLNVIKDFSTERLSQVVDSVINRNYKAFIFDEIERQLTKNEVEQSFTYSMEHRERIHQQVKQNATNELYNEFCRARSVINQLSEEDFLFMAKFLSYPRGCSINSREKYILAQKGKQMRLLLNRIGKNNLDLLGVNLNDVKNFFVNSLSSSSAPYLKTPSVIITFNDFLTTGGHNLSSKISRVNSLTNYKRDNYYDSDYAEERTERDVAKSAPKSTLTPSTNVSPKPTAKGPNTAKTNVPNSSSPSSHKKTSAKPSSSGVNIRSRSTVIPATSRTQRGF